MHPYPSYPGIPSIIVSTSFKLAKALITELGLPNRELEDFVQEFVIYGCSLLNTYRPGEVSLNTYLTRKMQLYKVDLHRTLTADRRNTALHTRLASDLSWESDGDTATLLEESSDDDITGEAHVADLLNKLTEEERRFAMALMSEKSIDEAAQELGLTHGAACRLKAAIAKKLRLFEKSVDCFWHGLREV